MGGARLLKLLYDLWELIFISLTKSSLWAEVSCLSVISSSLRKSKQFKTIIYGMALLDLVEIGVGKAAKKQGLMETCILEAVY